MLIWNQDADLFFVVTTFYNLELVQVNYLFQFIFIPCKIVDFCEKKILFIPIKKAWKNEFGLLQEFQVV